MRTAAFLSLLLMAGCLGDPSGGGRGEALPTVDDPMVHAAPTAFPAPLPPPAEDSTDEGPRPPAPPPGVVVADIGPGTNPYHAAFRRAGPEWQVHPCHRVALLACDLPVLDLTFGDTYEGSLAADAAVWENYTLDQPHWVRGTALILMTHRPFDSLEPGFGHSFHGSASSGAVADACRECYVLALQDSESIDGTVHHLIAETMPWVDLVVSTNFPGPGYYPPTGYPAYAEGTRALHDSGRLFFGASLNTVVSGVILASIAGVPVPLPLTDYSMPPWVVLVGGGHSECRLGEALSGHPAEFVGNFTQRLPAAESLDERRWTAGTSFSAPQVAGAFGRALHQVRQVAGGGRTVDALVAGPPQDSPWMDDGLLTQEELRAAMGQAADLWDVGRVDVANVACQQVLGSTQAYPLPPSATPWVDFGWGWAGPREAEAAAGLLLGTSDAVGKSAEAEAYMAAFMDARRALYPDG